MPKFSDSHAKNSEKAVSEMLADFERRESPFSLQVRGISLWRVVRSSVFSEIENMGLEGGGSVARKHLIKAAMRSLPLITLLLIRRTKIKYGVVSYPVALRVPDDDGRYADFYYQKILDAIPGGIRILHGPTSKKDKKTKEGIQNLDLSLIYLVAAAIARIFPVRSSDDAYAKLAEMISRNFAIEGMDAKSLACWFSAFWWRCELKRWLFRIIGLKTILTVNSGEYAVVCAAINCGINTIELQHGIYTENHPDVLSHDVVIKYGRKALFLPDIIGLYGEYWVDLLRRTYVGTQVRVMAVGSNICDWSRMERAKRYAGSRALLTVLVTTQGTQKEALVEFIKKVLEAVSPQVRFVIKLHPSYDRDKIFYSSRLPYGDRVKIVAGDALPATFDLLCSVDLHASIASTCHYDALMIGVPTIVIGLPGSELVSPLIRDGSAVLANSPEVMARIIENREWVVPSQEDQERYCKSNFIENIKKLAYDLCDFDQKIDR